MLRHIPPFSEATIEGTSRVALKSKGLTAAFVNSVKEPAKYHDSRGTGLFLLVNPATTQALALPRQTHKPKHRKSLPYPEVSECIEAVRASDAWRATKLALEFLILTASRSGEVRLARWEEIDFETSTWTVPADRAKQRRPHRAPLSARATESGPSLCLR